MTTTTTTATMTGKPDDQLRAAVREALAVRGATVYGAARQAGLHDDQLRGWLSGRRRAIRSDLLGRVLSELGVAVRLT